ncbi:hypothetical protein [Faecalispora jeddahensis]|uniref:hypothetical protein n=1 Tax=Faecalispora jeddahensis TaxID=1414721 RepID=UPI001D6F7CE5|nr:hypothetical protein [Faecalispora jeddahensis]MBE6744734.1 hypothetical protein [Oscillospiraceae bacterium]
MPELWIPSGGTNRKIKELYIPSGGVNRKIKEAYAPSGGVTRKIFSGVSDPILAQYYSVSGSSSLTSNTFAQNLSDATYMAINVSAYAASKQYNITSCALSCVIIGDTNNYSGQNLLLHNSSGIVTYAANGETLLGCGLSIDPYAGATALTGGQQVPIIHNTWGLGETGTITSDSATIIMGEIPLTITQYVISLWFNVQSDYGKSTSVTIKIPWSSLRWIPNDSKPIQYSGG